MKKFILITFIAGIICSLNACSPAYVRERPVSIEMARPPSPGNNRVWRDGNWRYERRNHAYRYDQGYWVKPNRGRTYAPGQWKSSPRGHYWQKGRWK